ncbi:GNAT family N-acetyltransferase [Streptomyces sp. 184]|uniref:GNAT family N-acetyltransferase n=1 Tax=Streptomyces sp. 184 TaxID=1827526 RepID=UPI003892106F
MCRYPRHLAIPSPSDLAVRPYTPADERTALDLVNADRLPGQPPATPAMLADALAGRSRADADWWAELDPPATAVATGPGGAVFGIVSYALRPGDDTGVILWAHCRERPPVAHALVGHAVAALAPRAIDAFHITSALSLGLECLPVRNRPATRAALARAGFADNRRWRYLRRELPAPELPRLPGPVIGPGPDGDQRKRQLTVRDEATGTDVAEALVGAHDGYGALWWIGVEEHSRGRGLARRLLGSALATLTDDLGASQVILLLDDDDTDATAQDVRDRTAAGALYDRAGFTEVDVLHAFTRAPAPAPVSTPSPASASAPT